MNQMQKLPPASIEIPPLAALALITHIQLASRHPAVKGDKLITKIAIDCAKQLQNLFNPESATYQMLELGWNPDEDRHLPAEPCSEPGEDFKNNLGCRCTGYKTAEVINGDEDIPPEVLASGAAMFKRVKELFEAEGFEVISSLAARLLMLISALRSSTCRFDARPLRPGGRAITRLPPRPTFFISV